MKSVSKSYGVLSLEVSVSCITLFRYFEKRFCFIFAQRENLNHFVAGLLIFNYVYILYVQLLEFTQFIVIM